MKQLQETLPVQLFFLLFLTCAVNICQTLQLIAVSTSRAEATSRNEDKYLKSY